MNKAFSEELTLVKNVMDFHIYEEQLFAKERLQRVQTLKGEVEADKEEIKESDWGIILHSYCFLSKM